MEKAGKYNAVEAGAIVTKSILLDDIAVLYVIAEREGSPKYHPYFGLTSQ